MLAHIPFSHSKKNNNEFCNPDTYMTVTSIFFTLRYKEALSYERSQLDLSREENNELIAKVNRLQYHTAGFIKKVRK